MHDPIVEEIRKIREAYARKFNFDLDAIVKDLQEKARRSGRKMVSFPPKRLGASEKATAKKKRRRRSKDEKTDEQETSQTNR